MDAIQENLSPLLHEGLPFVDDHIIMQISPSQGVSVLHYENTLPPFAEVCLEQRYGNIFSSIEHLKLFGGTKNVSTYIAHEKGDIKTILLYKRDKSSVHVLNEGIDLENNEVKQFTQYIFDHYASVRSISFHAVQASVHNLEHPFQIYDCLEDIVLTFRGSPEEYKHSLGKSTRNYLNRYQNKLRKAFPSYRHVVYERHEIKEEHIHAILNLNKLRMEGIGKTFNRADNETEQILKLAQATGLVSMILIDGQVCAGTINYRSGNNYFLEAIGHHPQYNEFGMGTLCCYYTICACLERDSHEYHFLWGNNEYKFRLGGKKRNLQHLAIYRSRLQIVHCMPLVFGNIHKEFDRKARVQVRQIRHSVKTALANWKRFDVSRIDPSNLFNLAARISTSTAKDNQ